jgi:molecular chaperone GrpE
VLEAELAAAKEQLLRTLADMENLRRRTEREVAETRSYAVSNFARDVISVGDNLARALEALPEDARKSVDAAVIALLEGVQLTERELLKTLEKHGVRKVDPMGEKFDPNFHQAMFEVPNPDVPNGTVVQVVQAGYKIGDRVLRPAMVGIGRGGPKAAPAAEASQAEPGATVDRTV